MTRARETKGATSPGRHLLRRGLVPLGVGALWCVALVCSGCSFGLDFDAIEACATGQVLVDGVCACPAETTLVGDACVCLTSGEAPDAGGVCPCPEGAERQNGECTCGERGPVVESACMCPPGMTFQNDRCACADGREAVALPEGLGDAPLCGACPVDLTTTGGGVFGVPGESGWCAGVLREVGVIGDAARSLVDVVIYETSPAAYVVLLVQTDPSGLISFSPFDVTLDAAGVAQVTALAAPNVGPIQYADYWGSALIRVGGAMRVVVSSAADGLVGFTLSSGEPMVVAVAGWSEGAVFEPNVVERIDTGKEDDGLLTIGNLYDLDSWRYVAVALLLDISDDGATTTLQVDPIAVDMPFDYDPVSGAMRYFSPNEIEAVVGSQGIFVAYGLDLGGVDRCTDLDALCLETTALWPGMLEIIVNLDLRSIALREATISATSHQDLEDAKDAMLQAPHIEALVTDPATGTVDRDRLGFFNVVASASGKSVVSIALSLFVTCEDADSLYPCDYEGADDWLNEVTLPVGRPVAIGTWTRDTTRFELDGVQLGTGAEPGGASPQRVFDMKPVFGEEVGASTSARLFAALSDDGLDLEGGQADFRVVDVGEDGQWRDLATLRVSRVDVGWPKFYKSGGLIVLPTNSGARLLSLGTRY